MTIPNVDSTTLNNLVPNLDTGDVADPALRLDAFQFIYAQLQVIVNELNNLPAGNIQNLSITAAKIANLAIETGKIANLAVTTEKLKDLSVTLGKMAMNSVGTTQLVDLAVTSEKVANGTLTAAKFVPGSLTNDTQNALRITNLESEVAIEISNLSINKADKSEIEVLEIEKADQADLVATNATMTLKANISDVNTQIASVASGSPKGAYATLSALTAAIPAGNTNIYVVAADGKWYYWTGSVWSAGGTYQSTGIPDSSIVPQQLSFIPIQGVPSKNLFDKDTAISGKYVLSNTGGLDDLVGRSASDWIPVLPSTAYKKVDDQQMAFYTSAKVYISGLTVATTFTTPANCYFIRITIRTANVGIEQVELGSVSTSYENHQPKINKLNVSDKSIEKPMLNFLPISGSLSKNLFNKNTALKDKYILYTNGAVDNLVGYYASDWIPVSANTSYIRRQLSHIAFYTAAKVYISGLSSANTFTTPSNAAFIRISINAANLDTEQVETGVVRTYYESFGTKIENPSLPFQLQTVTNYNDFNFYLPNDIYLVKGESFSIYYNNVIKYSQKYRRGNYYVTHILQNSTPTATVKGEGYADKWTITPSVAETFTMEFAILETYTGLKVASKMVVFHVADSASAANHGRTANVITIGDSFFPSGLIAEALYNFVTTKGGINNINLLGTRATTVAGVKTDAIAGWSYENYNIYEQVASDVNPFWNPSTDKFDFAYYMNQNYPTYVPASETGNHIDAFVSLCGINDLSISATDDTKRQYIQAIIDSVHAFDPAIKILLGTTTPQPLDDKWSTNYQNDGRHYEKFKYKQELQNDLLLSYENPLDNIYLLPTAAHFDTRSSIRTQAFYPDKFDPTYSEILTWDIHPTEIGGKYMADAVYQFLYNNVLR
jgi:hypothetical protein